MTETILRIAVIIVNYCTTALSVDCLRSLEADGYITRHGGVIVVDNASGDDSCEVIGQAIAAYEWSSWAELVPAERNGGFAYGNNLGIAQCGVGKGGRRGDENERIPPSWYPALSPSSLPDYVLLLNPDTVVRSGAVEALVRFMDEHPEVGIAGSRLEDPDGTSQQAARRFPAIASEFESAAQFGPISRLFSRWIVSPPERNQQHACDWLPGASLMIRREVFDHIGLLDEGYFMYFEEVEFCLRAKRAGWQVWYVPESRVIHLVGQSSGVTSESGRQRRRPKYWFDARRRYFLKNHGRVYLVMANLAWMFGHVLHRCRAFLQRKPIELPHRLFVDFVRYSF